VRCLEPRFAISSKPLCTPVQQLHCVFLKLVELMVILRIVTDTGNASCRMERLYVSVQRAGQVCPVTRQQDSI